MAAQEWALGLRVSTLESISGSQKITITGEDTMSSLYFTQNDISAEGILGKNVSELTPLVSSESNS